jgi:hypothetical protein
MNWRGKIQFCLWWSVCSLLVHGQNPDSSVALPLLTNATQVRQLSAWEAARNYPVNIQGVVTCYDPDWGLFFVQDSTAGIFVYLESKRFPVLIGQLVEVRG